MPIRRCLVTLALPYQDEESDECVLFHDDLSIAKANHHTRDDRGD